MHKSDDQSQRMPSCRRPPPRPPPPPKRSKPKHLPLPPPRSRLLPRPPPPPLPPSKLSCSSKSSGCWSPCPLRSRSRSRSGSHPSPRSATLSGVWSAAHLPPEAREEGDNAAAAAAAAAVAAIAAAADALTNSDSSGSSSSQYETAVAAVAAVAAAAAGQPVTFYRNVGTGGDLMYFIGGSSQPQPSQKAKQKPPTRYGSVVNISSIPTFVYINGVPDATTDPDWRPGLKGAPAQVMTRRQSSPSPQRSRSLNPEATRSSVSSTRYRAVIYLPIYLPTYLPTYLRTHLPTCPVQGPEASGTT